MCEHALSTLIYRAFMYMGASEKKIAVAGAVCSVTLPRNW
jgi:hypothetical protein